MAHGGFRPGSGRKTGSATKRTRDIADKAAATGLTPLDYLLSIMRDAKQAEAKRIDCAKAAAPYIHPRLSTVEAKVEANVEASITCIELVAPDMHEGSA